jgi:16S rRNA (uracil1498-N3)-methyltransferase
MTRRYFVPRLPAQGGTISLDDVEAHHAINVMRIRVGEQVCLFDGAGNEASAVVQTVGRRDVFCEASSAQQIDRENRIALTVGVAMPKGDRSKELVERLTELGVTQLVPLHCKRTQWPVPENAILKWQRVVIDACKQSGRNQLMRILSPQPVASWLADSTHAAASRFIAHPSENNACDLGSLNVTEQAVVAIGPEGGFSHEEVAIAEQNGWHALSLGSRIYRIETAAIIVTIKLAGL